MTYFFPLSLHTRIIIFLPPPILWIILFFYSPYFPYFFTFHTLHLFFFCLFSPYFFSLSLSHLHISFLFLPSLYTFYPLLTFFLTPLSSIILFTFPLTPLLFYSPSLQKLFSFPLLLWHTPFFFHVLHLPLFSFFLLLLLPSPSDFSTKETNRLACLFSLASFKSRLLFLLHFLFFLIIYLFM